MAANLSTTSKKIDTILVLDFGSQYTQLIARRVRESNVYSEILPWDIDEEKIKSINPKGIILSGGPDSVTNSYTPRVPQIVFELNIPIMGICYGMQTLAEQLGGQVISSEQKEPLFPAAYDVPILIDKYDGQEYEEGDEEHSSVNDDCIHPLPSIDNFQHRLRNA